ncbi:CBS domain-containing protein [Streptomyces sp. NK08204]|uniref:CBS domain-containing protein n=1 Tax=Streptomyces sp. NK08204 TaxID=2873260 RepID=UPI001CEC8229|nr:CBS domain-containing protein [Streptomyces sp. NK08204]
MARNVRDVMARVPAVVDAGASVTSVARTMRDQHTALVLVVADGEPMGLVSDRDLVVGAVADGTDPQRLPVARTVRGELITVDADDDVVHAARTMREHAVRRAAVLDGGTPVGLVCLGGPVAEAPSAPTVAPTPDPPGDAGPGT